LAKLPLDEDACAETSDFVALHFSHAATAKTGHHVEDRPKLARDTIKFMMTDCETNSKLTLVSSTSAPTAENGKPYVYTFFDEVDPDAHDDYRTELRKTDKALLEGWKESWQKAGFEPKVLTLADAQSHPQYKEFVAKLESTKLIGKGPPGVRYNQLCFIRWLAMAAAGGGFMCDYDVFPIKDSKHILKLYTGDFFTYDRVPGYGGLPSLMAGTQSEWLRMANAILDHAHNTKPNNEYDAWSDMYALLELNKAHPGTYGIEDVVGEVDGLLGNPFGKDSCEQVSGFVALHFSHSDIYKTGHQVSERPTLAKHAVEYLWDHCGTTTTTTKAKNTSIEPAKEEQQQPSSSSDAQENSNQTEQEKRPFIYIFYDDVDPENQDKNRAQLREADAKLIKAWQSHWHDAGWNPRVLTTKDAEQHAQYDDFVAKVDKIALIGEGGAFGRFNRLNIIRWLAMAAVDGGFMSDYDVFPIRKSSSISSLQKGDFTVYDASPGDGGIPSLMSGSAKEWLRMANELVDVALSTEPTNSFGGWSDLYLLLEIHKRSPDAYTINRLVGNVDPLIGQPLNRKSCELLEPYVALHFSHADAKKTGNENKDRSDLAKHTMSFIKDHCKLDEQ